MANGALMVQCNKTHYCCDHKKINQGCCSKTDDLLNLGFGTSLTITMTPAASLSPLLTPSISVTAFTALVTTSAFSTPREDSDNTSVRIGAGVGIPLGVAFLLGLCYMMWLKRSLKSHLGEEKKDDITSTGNRSLVPAFSAQSTSLHGYNRFAAAEPQNAGELPQLPNNSIPKPELCA